jgi:hypothetical protein
MCTFTFTFMAIWSDDVGTAEAEDRFVLWVMRSLFGTLSETFAL